MPLSLSAAVKARLVRRARSMMVAVRSVAFSRPRSPIRPSSFESVMSSSPSDSSRRISAARSSQSGFSGEKTLATATERRPMSRIRRVAPLHRFDGPRMKSLPLFDSSSYRFTPSGHQHVSISLKKRGIRAAPTLVTVGKFCSILNQYTQPSTLESTQM